jgi:hypothetical protein
MFPLQQGWQRQVDANDPKPVKQNFLPAYFQSYYIYQGNVKRKQKSKNKNTFIKFYQTALRHSQQYDKQRPGNYYGAEDILGMVQHNQRLVRKDPPNRRQLRSGPQAKQEQKNYPGPMRIIA